MRQRMRIDKQAGHTVAAQKPAAQEAGSDRLRVTLTFDRAQLSHIDQVAARAGIPRSALINLCVTIGLPVLESTLGLAQRSAADEIVDA